MQGNRLSPHRRRERTALRDQRREDWHFVAARQGQQTNDHPLWLIRSGERLAVQARHIICLSRGKVILFEASAPSKTGMADRLGPKAGGNDELHPL